MKLRAQESLDRDGFYILKSAMSRADVRTMREAILKQKDKMAITRAAAHSRHLAGFHRYKALADVHETLANNAMLQEALAAHFGAGNAELFGLSDITINRSQHWHTDLLRGKYAQYLDGIDAWARLRAACIKALAYLQDGKSLRIVPGSHKSPTPLDDVALEALAERSRADQLTIAAGDIVLMDLRALHRGSTDAEMSADELQHSPKILVSTVVGHKDARLTQAMARGNAKRLADWDARHQPQQPTLIP